MLFLLCCVVKCWGVGLMGYIIIGVCECVRLFIVVIVWCMKLLSCRKLSMFLWLSRFESMVLMCLLDLVSVGSGVGLLVVLVIGVFMGC